MSKSTSKLFYDEKEFQQEEVIKEEKTETPTLPAETTELASKPDDDIKDVEIQAIKKQRFRFNHDNSMILELNTSDLNIVTRLSTSYEKLNKIMEDVGKVLTELPDGEAEDEQLKSISDGLKKLDDAMRKELDTIFDAPVSDVLGRDGSMYDPMDGMFRYEHIIETLVAFYENNLSNEFAKMRARVASRTDKYVKGSKGAKYAPKYHN